MITMPATQVRAHLSDLLNRVMYQSESAVIERHGTPVAALVPIKSLKTLEAIERLLADERIQKVLEEHAEGEEVSVDELRERLLKQ